MCYQFFDQFHYKYIKLNYSFYFCPPGSFGSFFLGLDSNLSFAYFLCASRSVFILSCLFLFRSLSFISSGCLSSLIWSSIICLNFSSTKLPLESVTSNKYFLSYSCSVNNLYLGSKTFHIFTTTLTPSYVIIFFQIAFSAKSFHLSEFKYSSTVSINRFSTLYVAIPSLLIVSSGLATMVSILSIFFRT